GLQYRIGAGTWQPVGFSDFPYPRFATPQLSVVSTQAYEHGAATERLLGSSKVEWDEGAGLNGVAVTPVWRAGGDALEWEWPLVVRRFADGPLFAEDDTVLELRVVDGNARPASATRPARLTLKAAPGHLGGTFVETPARLGPYQSTAGGLFFFME